MSTRWDAKATAEGFEAYDDLPERTLGYPQVFRAVGLGQPDVRRVLDYGCGPGKVASRVVERFDVSVLAVDASPAMLEIARRDRSHPRIEYHHVPEPPVPVLAEASVDAAMSCYVLISIGSLDVIRGIVAEVHRVLRPGARYAILDTNPNTTGVDFSTFRSGEPGRTYAGGEQREVLLRLPDGTDLTLLDFYWPAETYAEVLQEAGFRRITTHRPLLDHAVDPPGPELDGVWRGEREQPPFLITVGER